MKVCYNYYNISLMPLHKYSLNQKSLYDLYVLRKQLIDNNNLYTISFCRDTILPLVLLCFSAIISISILLFNSVNNKDSSCSVHFFS